MKQLDNPFVVGKYVSPDYFCDRKQETTTLLKHLTNGRNVALISPRRMGKSGLIEHTFGQPALQAYRTFFIDIYGTRSFAEFIYLFGKSIFQQLKPLSTQWRQRFVQVVRSLQVGIKFDPATASPMWDVSIGDISNPKITLDEIFEYIDSADSPCIIAFDEFQQIANYTDEVEIEAVLRSKIQHCRNAQFIFAGSRRHLMSQMFLSPSKPFYQSVVTMGLEPIPLTAYTEFAVRLFSENGKTVQPEVVESVYNAYSGVSWFVQMMMNELFALTAEGGTCAMEMLPIAQKNVINGQEMAFRTLMDTIPTKQKEVLLAVAKEGEAQNITSAAFVRRHRLTSPSSVQSAVKSLLATDLLTHDNGTYRVYDYFFADWLRTSF